MRNEKNGSRFRRLTRWENELFRFPWSANVVSSLNKYITQQELELICGHMLKINLPKVTFQSEIICNEETEETGKLKNSARENKSKLE